MRPIITSRDNNYEMYCIADYHFRQHIHQLAALAVERLLRPPQLLRSHIINVRIGNQQVLSMLEDHLHQITSLRKMCSILLLIHLHHSLRKCGQVNPINLVTLLPLLQLVLAIRS